jgi:hypothetical protein
VAEGAIALMRAATFSIFGITFLSLPVVLLLLFQKAIQADTGFNFRNVKIK